MVNLRGKSMFGTMRFLGPLTALMSCGLAIATDTTQVATSDLQPERIEAQVVLSERFGHFEALVNCGTLTAGRPYEFNLTLQNPSAREIDASKVRASCSCINIKQSARTLPPKGELKLSFTTTVPKTSRSPTGAWRVDLRPIDTGTTGIHLRLEYELAGLLNFIDDHAVLKIEPDAGEARFLIPLLVTTPVKREDIQIELPKELSMAKGSIVREDGKHFLELLVSSKGLPPAGMSGAIRCIDPVTGREDEVFCVLESATGLSVFPSLLRFRPDEEHGDELRATAILKFDREADPTTKPMIDAIINGRAVSVEPSKLLGKVSRVSLILEADASEKLRDVERKKRKVVWQVRWGKHVFRKSSLIDLP